MAKQAAASKIADETRRHVIGPQAESHDTFCFVILTYVKVPDCWIEKLVLAALASFLSPSSCESYPSDLD